MITKKKLMEKYAKLCGYNYIPFTWKEDDYTIKGWINLSKRRENEQKFTMGNSSCRC
jgi:hypothetical protein